MSNARASEYSWKLGLGAGLLGAAVVALKYALRPAVMRRVPDAISPARFTTKVLHTTLGEVVYHEAGQGPLLIFVHDVCLGGSSFEWSRVYPEFASHYRVVALDLVGFGESARPARRSTAADYVKVLAEFTRALDWLEPPIFIASGLGAGFCVALASQHPRLVGGLILHQPSGTGEFGAQWSAPAARLFNRFPLLGRFFYRNHHATRTAVTKWLHRGLFTRPGSVTDEIIEVFATCAHQPGAEHAATSWLTGALALDLEACSERCHCTVELIEHPARMAALESPAEVASTVADRLENAFAAPAPTALGPRGK